jgi:hypothetical protein
VGGVWRRSPEARPPVGAESDAVDHLDTGRRRRVDPSVTLTTTSFAEAGALGDDGGERDQRRRRRPARPSSGRARARAGACSVLTRWPPRQPAQASQVTTPAPLGRRRAPLAARRPARQARAARRRGGSAKVAASSKRRNTRRPGWAARSAPMVGTTGGRFGGSPLIPASLTGPRTSQPSLSTVRSTPGRRRQNGAEPPERLNAMNRHHRRRDERLDQANADDRPRHHSPARVAFCAGDDRGPPSRRARPSPRPSRPSSGPRPSSSGRFSRRRHQRLGRGGGFEGRSATSRSGLPAPAGSSRRCR